MRRFVEGEDRRQPTLLPGCLEDYVTEENPARVIDAFVDELDLLVIAAATGRPPYHQATLLKLYIYGYLNRVQWSRRLEREAQLNVELMWLGAAAAAAAVWLAGPFTDVGRRTAQAHDPGAASNGLRRTGGPRPRYPPRATRPERPACGQFSSRARIQF